MNNIRVGCGFDVHKFAKNRRLMLGGIEIPHSRGLIGHSDADVLLHAIADALLGAAALPDIGQLFPPDDKKYLNADSTELLKIVFDKVREAGFPRIFNVDAVIMAERPRMHPHLSAMRNRIAAVLDIIPSQVGLKATTCETLGFVGREEGIAVSAVCLIGASD